VSGIQEGLSPPKEATLATEPAFSAVYQREFSYVWHSLRRLGVRPQDLPDVTHDVFMVLWRRFGDLDPTRQSRPWIFGMALRVAIAYRRRAFRLRERMLGDQHPDMADPAPPADVRLADAEQRRLVEEALGALDLDRRAVLIMHDFDGHGGAEIATTLGVPLKTMYSRLASARTRFVKAFRRAERRRRSS
jgi:RNA polymerase sigma-70 factor, ECF subfamily